jgi:hypothetical protein
VKRLLISSPKKYKLTPQGARRAQAIEVSQDGRCEQEEEEEEEGEEAAARSDGSAEVGIQRWKRKRRECSGESGVWRRRFSWGMSRCI